MMKSEMVANLKRYRQFFTVTLSILLIISISGCGEENYSSTDYSSGDTGSIAFTVVWEGAPTKQNSQTVSRALDCSAADVDTVTFEVFDGNQLLTDNSFECAAGSGTVNGVPVGTNRMLSVSGKDSNGTVVYYGEEPGITVTAGKDTPVGEIVCNRVDCTDYDSDDYYAEGGCGITVDCNDNDDTIYPGAIEICDDGKDNDCDGDTDCDDDECIGDVACNDTGAETIISGQWFGNAGFGDVKFDVTSEGSGIESFKVTFSDYTCETITHGGSITQTFNPADDFENRILEVNISLGGIQSSDYIAIEGTFEAAGDYISGTFELDNGTAVCSGSWNAHAGFAAPGTRIEDLAYDGTNLWATDYYDDIIYKLDPVTGEVL
ncbi:MAG: putative metal-binding motif-containing protein, partial [Deltaproteobacteria bacterium]|nr:putative metal-binding motif-containing protein [Deltaproteobacteria bacterium]